MRKSEVIIVAQQLERQKRSIREAAVKAQQKESHFSSITTEPACPEDNTMYQKYPTCICIAREHVQVRSLLQLRSQSHYTMRPQHAGSRAQPAVGNKQACCDANGYGCTEGRLCVRECSVLQQIRVTKGAGAQKYLTKHR